MLPLATKYASLVTYKATTLSTDTQSRELSLNILPLITDFVGDTLSEVPTKIDVVQIMRAGTSD